jgi:hypothetical protein
MDPEYKSPSAAHLMTGLCSKASRKPKYRYNKKCNVSRCCEDYLKKAPWKRELPETLTVARLPQKFANF